MRLEDDERTSWLGGTRWTDENGFFSITVDAPARLAGADLVAP